MGWNAMPDVKGIERVQRLRKTRRERGDREMNVWVPQPIAAAIDEAVDSGRFKRICCKFGFYLSIATKLQKLVAAKSTT